MSRYKEQQKKTLSEIIIEQRITIFALAITILGLIFIFVSSLPSEFRDLGISLIPAGILTAITELYLRKDFMREFREAQYRYAFFAQLEKLGIKNIYESRRKEDVIFGAIAESAKNNPLYLKKLQIMGMSLDPFMHIVGSYMDDLLMNGCKFQFLSLDANSDLAKSREIEHDTTGLRDRIRSFDEWIKKYMEKKDYCGIIEARKHSLMPTFHITIINEETLFVNIYPISGSGWDFPIIEIDQRGLLFGVFKKQFEIAWNKAKSLQI
jgi:hypothetical protein